MGQTCRRLIPGSLEDHAIHFAQRFPYALEFISECQIVLKNIKKMDAPRRTGPQQFFTPGAGRAEHAGAKCIRVLIGGDQKIVGISRRVVRHTAFDVFNPEAIAEELANAKQFFIGHLGRNQQSNSLWSPCLPELVQTDLAYF